jgi:YidC/Oxa1 family membrane protein insertase
MFDGLFELISGLLSAIYSVVPNYAIAIALLTCVAMLITTPLTLKSTKSMIAMQRLQPEIRKLQAQYKGDRQKLNEEMMRFYKENEINPVGGCLPMVIQMPVFSILYWVVRGLVNPSRFSGFEELLKSGYGLNPKISYGFDPKYLNHSSDLYQNLHGATKMSSFGIDLAQSPSAALQDGILHALPYLAMLTIIGVLAWFQQKQIMGRNKHVEVTDQQKMMMRIGPVFQIFITFVSPAALGIYFLVSTSWRVAQQAYITRSLYGGEDSVGVQAQKAMAAARAEKKSASGNGAPAKRAARSTSAAKASSNGGGGSTRNPGKQAQTAKSGAGTAANPHPRSRKKKKRR